MKFLIFFLGSAVGSFFNLFFSRREKNEDFIWKSSYCQNCKRKLKMLDMIPIISFLIYRGHSKYCKCKIPIDILIFEAIYGLIFISFYLIYGLNLNFLLRALEFSLLFLVGYCDFKTGFIYLLDLIFLLSLQIIYKIINGEQILVSCKYAIILGLIFAFIVILTGAMGLGDLEFAFVGGFFAYSYLDILEIFTISFVGAAIVGLFLIFISKKTIKDTIAFGPYIAMAIFLQIFS